MKKHCMKNIEDLRVIDELDAKHVKNGGLFQQDAAPCHMSKAGPGQPSVSAHHQRSKKNAAFSLFDSRQEVIESVDQRITGTTDHRTMCMILIILEHMNRPELSHCTFQHIFDLSPACHLGSANYRVLMHHVPGYMDQWG
jgi:hypothetical protein